ncbi:glycoside hydrolase family 108 protein [Cloacibacillus evryensis]|uniref:glycoside hydrolase family 108 protein n=1 Tax=Cloacibacillus evryensis TaxID=508460 RepID=UPI002671A69E|nr:glycosyl hydrolase 108 family protein [Cloacibacillus evryensis]
MPDRQDFERALSFTFGSEGGLSDHPADRGGLTNMGITIGTLHRAYMQRIVGHNDVKSLTRAEAAKIYEKFYWEPSAADEMPWPLCALHFDAAVNHGLGGAAKLLQRTLSKSRGVPLSIDGAIGPKTKRVLYAAMMDMEVNAQYRRAFCTTYLDYREQLFRAIVSNNPSQKVFLRGWLNRLEKNRKLI